MSLLKYSTICLFLCLTGCHPLKGHNYGQANIPRFADFSLSSKPSNSETIKIVSYNIKHGKKISRVINIFEKNKSLGDADILLLQEMNDQAVRELAKTFKYNYVYYPSAVHPIPKNDLGNAILSKWPIVKDYKVMLPHLDPQKLQRIAVGAHIKINNDIIAVHSVHMDIFLQPEQREDQVNTIANLVPEDINYSIIGGDFNSVTIIVYNSLIENFAAHDYNLATKNVSWTYKHWYFFNKKTRLDHIFSKNFEVIDAGMIKDRSASDHLPIWVELKLKK